MLIVRICSFCKKLKIEIKAEAQTYERLASISRHKW